jgi:hypothetical protein
LCSVDDVTSGGRASAVQVRLVRRGPHVQLVGGMFNTQYKV